MSQLRIQDLMLMSGMLDQAVTDSIIRKVPAPVREAMQETQRRVKAAQLKAPVPVQAAFQEKFHRQDCIALATCIEYARHWMERDGKHLDEATDAGMSHLQKKLNAYIQEMDAAGEMKEWINKKGKDLVQLK